MSMIKTKKILFDKFIGTIEKKLPIDVNKLGNNYTDIKNAIFKEYAGKSLFELKKEVTKIQKSPHKILEPLKENEDFMGKLKSVVKKALIDKYPQYNAMIEKNITTEQLKSIIESNNPLTYILEKEPSLATIIPQNNPELVESYQTLQNEDSKESTELTSVDKSSLHILVGIIVIANIFTYSTFKFLNPTNRSQIELAILYVIIYVYTVLYSIAICYMSKWVVRLVEVGMDIQLDANLELLEKLIKNIFDLAIYTLPFHILIGILSLAFQKHLMFDHNGNYLWSYQLFSCIISLVVAYMYNDKNISLDAEQIIRYYIIFVTVLSLIKMNVNIDGASTINRYADGLVSFFLNVNLKKILIIMPLIMMIYGIVLAMTDMGVSNSIKYICIVLLIFASILAISAFDRSKAKANANIDYEKTPKLPAIKAVSKWFIFMAVYLIPLYAYIAVTKGELVENFSKELMKTFDINFQIILAIGTIVLFILDKTFSAMDQKQITRLSSLMILVSIMLSKITPKPQV